MEAITRWGVETIDPVTENYFGAVRDWAGAGAPPQIWGRYLWDINRVQTSLASEVQILHQFGCKIFPIMNRLEHPWAGWAGQEAKHRFRGRADQRIYDDLRQKAAFERGRIAANEAQRMTSDAGIPGGIRIYADLENWGHVDPEWIHGWVDEFASTAYGSYKPGIYGSTTYGWARNLPGFFSGPVGSLLRLDQPPWRDLRIWASHGRDTRPPVRSARALATGLAFNPPRATPNEMARFATVLWQAWHSADRGHGSKIDVNLSTEEGYRDMF